MTIRTALLSLAVLIPPATVAEAAPVLQRVRGTIESVGDKTVMIKTVDGTSMSVMLAGDTKFASVVKSSLADVKDGVFIGTATKGDKPPTALELVVFPDSMRGTAEGHYDWDSITDTTLSGGKTVKSAMTNGTIKSTSRPMTKSAMTNGTVKSGMASGGSKTLTITYNSGKSLDIVVPPSAPIVAFEPADIKVLKPGGKIFVVAVDDAGKLDGKLVAVGRDGVTPPM